MNMIFAISVSGFQQRANCYKKYINTFIRRMEQKKENGIVGESMSMQ